MKITYANDTEKGPGHGVLRVSQTSLALPLADCRFTVRRSSDAQCLIPDGWQDAEKPLAPAAVTQEEETLLLFVGPDVVDQLDELETYRLTLLADESKDAGILELGDVLYSPRRGGKPLQEVVDPPPPPPPPLPPPVEEPSPPPMVEMPPVADPPVAPPPPPPFVEEPVRPPRPRWPWLLAGLVLLLGLAAGVWYFFQLQRQTVSSVVPSTPVEIPPATPVEAKPDVEPPVPVKPDAAQDKPAPEFSDMDKAREFLRGKGPADTALELSRAMSQTPSGREAAFLLLGYAAETGLGEAMMDLARFYDPTDTAPTGSIRKDAEQAWFWNAKAKAAGQAGAQERLDALRAWLRQEADKGDAAARDLLGTLALIFKEKLA